MEERAGGGGVNCLLLLRRLNGLAILRQLLPPGK